MGRAPLSRRTVLGVLTAASTGGCVGRVLDRPSVAVTGVRVHNWTHDGSDIRLELFRDGESVLAENLSLAPLGEPGSVASFEPAWSVEPARYRIDLAAATGDATYERQFPADDFSWNGCAYIDADLESDWHPGQPVDPDADRWFESHLQAVTSPDDFSSEYCSDG
ncbi:hypothetical protein [Halovivax cerinus]|uniref:Uncharacterized protein n=1 Tax=Halovivax cerinus TaxID=1487865 RepID=A0ABD5NT28_9EURY|nr:hypothetical protein [Halovivax cerinus]